MRNVTKKLVLVVFFLSVHVFSLFGWDPFTFFPPMQVLYHPVSTTSNEAQEAFNVGLTAIYAFNYDEAMRSFEKASEIDPDLAMAYWGIALACDENLDRTVNPNHAKLTVYLSQKALELSKNATPNEQAYIQALSKRFSEDPNMDRNILRAKYSEAMKKVAEDFPDDLDASVLYAESMMDLLAWDLWSMDGKPHPHAFEIVDRLESVLKRDPYHLGANHYYIHSIENSPYPERGLMSAYVLDHLNLRDWGHLLHTTSHIYIPCGDYERAVHANEKGIESDQRYIAKYGIDGRYPFKYLCHNFFYLTQALMWQERYHKSLASANDLTKLVHHYIKQAPSYAFNLLMPLEVKLYFHKWDEILHTPEPSNELELVFWNFTRTIAYAATGNIKEAEKLCDVFLIQKEVLLKKENDGYVTSKLTIAENLAYSEIAKAKGKAHESAVWAEKAFQADYNAGLHIWVYPLYATVGARWIEAKNYDKAEQYFRAGLKRYAKNGRTLFGLFSVLQLQNKPTYWIEREMKEALRFSDEKLTLENL